MEVAVAKLSVARHERRRYCPSVAVHQIFFQMPERKEVSDRAQESVDDLQEIDADNEVNHLVDKRQYQDAAQKENPAKADLFGNARPETDTETLNQYFGWALFVSIVGK